MGFLWMLGNIRFCEHQLFQERLPESQTNAQSCVCLEELWVKCWKHRSKSYCEQRKCPSLTPEDPWRWSMNIPPKKKSQKSSAAKPSLREQLRGAEQRFLITSRAVGAHSRATHKVLA